MPFIKDLFEKPTTLSKGSKYAVCNGVIFLALGLLFIVWPGVTQNALQEIELLWGTNKGSSVS